MEEELWQELGLLQTWLLPHPHKVSRAWELQPGLSLLTFRTQTSMLFPFTSALQIPSKFLCCEPKSEPERERDFGRCVSSLVKLTQYKNTIDYPCQLGTCTYFF